MICLSHPIENAVHYRKRGQSPEREGFYAKFELTDSNVEAGTFEGYASVFGRRIDCYPPTIMDRGAFLKTLAESRSRVRILWAHDPTKPIGRPLEMREDSHGLYIKAQISPTQLGRDALILLRDHAVDELSVGFDPIRWDMLPDPDNKGQQIRHLKEVRLWEVSVVAFAADPSAIIAAVHARRGDRRNILAELQTQQADLVRDEVRRKLIDLQLIEIELAAKRLKA